jgi:predicted GIY-YIG superfamily endonuclease
VAARPANPSPSAILRPAGYGWRCPGELRILVYPKCTPAAKDALRSFSVAGPPALDFHPARLIAITFEPHLMHYVYLIESLSHIGNRYVGYTEDLKQRIADHNAGKNESTAEHRPWKLRTYLAFSTKAQAIAFERYLKSGSGHAFARKRLW